MPVATGQLHLPLMTNEHAGAGYPMRRGGRLRPDKMPWSELAKRTFDIDVTQCARCGHSPIRIVAVVVAPTREQLAMLGAKDAVPTRFERSRAPPPGQMRFAFPQAAA